ncbi:MAG: 5-bromo-4-chloroindolyl phosphate hydrolysis family protein [Leptospiraceae bacterium]|nr:5-bromo-4-chloroindolyl phosphate hydrolysis family protein [Leptospiraceae bacterium]MCP5496141.1 5-bromo-4-chloroindolyl phosphate hydrolysis family protein [Leptospiraceae bacterium]
MNETTNREEKKWARRAHLSTALSYLLMATPLGFTFSFLANLITPFIIWLTRRNEGEYSSEQAKEAVFLQGFLAAAFGITSFFSAPVNYIMIVSLIIYHFIELTTAMIKTSYGKDFHYPFSFFPSLKKRKQKIEEEYHIFDKYKDKASAAHYKETIQSLDKTISDVEGILQKIKNESIRFKVKRILGMLEKLKENYKKDPRDIQLSRQFLSYYPDATVKILNKYVELYNQNIQTQEIIQSMQKVDSVLDSIFMAFEKLYEKLLSNDVMELDSEIEVLEKITKLEGM